jgi:Spy/CpxP family protein refolding chaperone
MTTLACKDSAPPPPAATATAEAVKAPAAAAPAPTAAATAPSEAAGHGKWKGRRGRGIAGMMLHAAHSLDLKDAQKATLDKLAEQLHGDHAGPPSEMKDYHAALAAQVRAGKIDAAKLDPLEAAVDKAHQARSDKEAEVLNGLYAALEPAQRKALVAAVRAKQTEHQAKMGGPDAAKHRLEHLTKQLDLDAAQQKRVEPLLAKDDHSAMDEMKKHSEAVLAAFEGDGFDAKKLEPAAGAAKKGMAQHAQFLAALLPVIKPEQREKLAAEIEKAPRSPHGEEGAAEEGAGEAPAAQ